MTLRMDDAKADGRMQELTLNTTRKITSTFILQVFIVFFNMSDNLGSVQLQ